MKINILKSWRIKIMAMKKKFLGLAMAAMVALPATSVYAWDKNGNTLSGNESDIMTQDVTVTGEVKVVKVP